MYQEENFDDMDFIMSQLDESVVLAKSAADVEVASISDHQEEFDEIDKVMSQMDNNCFNGATGYDENVVLAESEDEMDKIMSQMDQQYVKDADVEDRSISVPGNSIDSIEAGIPEELLKQYEEEVGILDEALVRRMENEPDDDANLPAEIDAEFQNSMDEILPVRSRDRYLQAYGVFVKWQESHGIKSFSEKVVMAYIISASRKYKPPTLWSIYSMLKKTFIVKHDMSKYCRLRAFLKTKNDGYESKKSNVFTPEEIKQFIVEAPNNVFLGMKVVLIFGLNGTLRGAELTELTTKNVFDDGKELRVKIPKSQTKTKKQKDYIICDEFANIVREYMNLRPLNAKSDRLFLQWRNGKCVNQVMGKHSIGKIPKEVAKYLNLPDPSSYTGHSYRRTSTTVAVDAGCTMDEIKRIGPWESTKVAELYVQDSLVRKRKVAKMFSNAVDLPSTSSVNVDDSGTVEGGCPVDIDDSEGKNRNNMERDKSLSQISIPAVSKAGSDGRRIFAPTSINVGSSSVSIGEKTFTITGAGECNNFTIINMK